MEILSQTDIYITPFWAVMVFVIGVISLVVCLIVSVENAHSYSDSDLVVSVICGILGLIMFITGLVVNSFFQVDSGRDQYEVIINEGVDTEEFLQKYEIIEQRDRIWVIEDREVEEND